MIGRQEALSLAGVISPTELLQRNPVRLIFDEDRVLLDTERYKTSGGFFPYPEDQGALGKFLSIAKFALFSEEHEPGLQKKKLEGLGIAHLFPEEDRHIFTDKLPKLAEVVGMYKARGELIALMDDRIDIVSRAKALGVRLPIWILRGPHPVDALAKGHDFRPFAKDLNAAFSIVSQTLAQRAQMQVLGQSSSSI